MEQVLCSCSLPDVACERANRTGLSPRCLCERAALMDPLQRAALMDPLQVLDVVMLRRTKQALTPPYHSPYHSTLSLHPLTPPCHSLRKQKGVWLQRGVWLHVHPLCAVALCFSCSPYPLCSHPRECARSELRTSSSPRSTSRHLSARDGPPPVRWPPHALLFS